MGDVIAFRTVKESVAREQRLREDHWRVSRLELAHSESELRQLWRERDTLGALSEQLVLVMRVLAAISDGHEAPRALAETVLAVMDRACSAELGG